MTPFDAAFQEVQSLVATFQANERHYLSPTYQESEARKDFIDKFFTALGWDVNHDHQQNPYAQEVKVERGVIMHGSQRRADYAFYLAPNYRDVQFYAEAKKPFGDIATADNCFQAVRYGWNSQTPVAVLTDFEQFVTLDCRYKPDIGTAQHRILRKFHYSEYTDKDTFACIYHLFSREAVANGGLDAYADTLPKQRGKAVQRGLFKGGYQSIDDTFLEKLDEYRDVLARAFKNNNSQLDGDTLTEITQRTIDRLVFIRFLEDKLIHPDNLISNFGDKGTAWQDFIAASKRLDGIYNGIVFKKHAILDAPAFKVNETAFADICEELSHVNSPFDFNTIPIHILGSIYERFLGKVIRATEKRAFIEEKPEVRKAGGVYYTPEYIVRYIVDNTVGKMVEGKTPNQIAEMRFADIACGSGSFLLGVYDCLLRYHGNWFNANPDKAKKAGCVLREDGGWHLSLTQRRQILLNNIYGVDIDTQAVEVSQLSLFLKLLEEETTASAQQYRLDFEQQAILPSLNGNIVCGNSLIGSDILSGELFEPIEEKKLNPMDYEQRFPAVMKRGGFDAIVGNPPYIFTRNQGISEVQKAYFYEHYKHQSAQLNTFGLFLEQSHEMLRKDALVGVITPNNWLTIDSFSEMRRFITEKTGCLKIVNILDRVFAAADVDTAITMFKKGKQTCVTVAEMQDGVEIFTKEVPVNAINPPSYIIQINLLKSSSSQALLNRINAKSSPLSLCATVSTGLKVYQVGKGKPAQSEKEKGNRVFHSRVAANKTYGRYLDGVNVSRYALTWSGEYLSYGDWIAEPRRSVPFTGERLLIRQIPSKPPYLVHAVFTSESYYNDINSMVVFAPIKGFSIKFLLGVINSKLLSFWFAKVYDKLQRKIFPQFKVKELSDFPICQIDFTSKSGQQQHDKIVSLVEQMMSAKQQFATAQTDRDKDFYTNKCEAIDQKIDALVYELYGLTPEEIQIVEADGN